jgi:hypothetical protein
MPAERRWIFFLAVEIGDSSAIHRSSGGWTRRLTAKLHDTFNALLNIIDPWTQHGEVPTEPNAVENIRRRHSTGLHQEVNARKGFMILVQSRFIGFSVFLSNLVTSPMINSFQVGFGDSRTLIVQNWPTAERSLVAPTIEKA